MSNVIPIRIDDTRIAEFFRAARISPRAWLMLTSSQKRRVVESVRAQYPIERVVAMINAYALRVRPTALRPAGDASDGAPGSDKPAWEILILFAIGFAVLEGSKFAAGVHKISPRLPRSR